MADKKLYALWRSNHDRRFVQRPVSMRLPVHVMARVNAINDLFPTKTRTEIMTDLLKVGLEAFEESLPPLAYSDEPVEIDENNTMAYAPAGVNADYRENANTHYRKLESELGNKKPPFLFDLSYKRVG